MNIHVHYPVALLVSGCIGLVLETAVGEPAAYDLHFCRGQGKCKMVDMHAIVQNASGEAVT
eukprot:1940914-Pyramimonas_sp.AAC.1